MTLLYIGIGDPDVPGPAGLCLRNQRLKFHQQMLCLWRSCIIPGPGRQIFRLQYLLRNSDAVAGHKFLLRGGRIIVVELGGTDGGVLDSDATRLR